VSHGVSFESTGIQNLDLDLDVDFDQNTLIFG